MLPETAALSASMPAATRFSDGLAIPFKKTRHSGGGPSCWKTFWSSQKGSSFPSAAPCKNSNLLSSKALPLFGFKLATPAETLRVRAKNLEKSFLELSTLVNAQEECLQRQQEELLYLQGILPSAKMDAFHRSCLQLQHQRVLFEQIIVQIIVRDALSSSEGLLSLGVETNEIGTTAQEHLETTPYSSVSTELRLKLSVLKSFVELEMACLFAPLLCACNSASSPYPAAVQESLCTSWAAVKEEVPVDETYYDYIDLIGKWGRQYPSPETIMENRASWSEARRHEDEEKVFSGDGIFSRLRRTIEDTIQKHSTRRVSNDHEKNYIAKCNTNEVPSHRESVKISTPCIL